MRARLRALAEQVQGSLFLIPTVFVAAGALLAVGGLALDERLTEAARLPIAVASTADSARSVLSTIASATMAFAGIAFSVALLVFQMSSSQYSPRVIHGLFRDGFNKRIMGVVLGTFTYCLVVLRSVHGEIESGPDAVVPTVSVSVAVLLGIVSVLAIVGFIDHNAHRMDVSEILQGVSDDTKARVKTAWAAARPPGDEDAELPSDSPVSDGVPVPARRDGWVQLLDGEQLLAALPPGGTMRMETAPGRYAVEGVAMCTVWPPPDDLEEITSRVNQAVTVGASRTLSQDPAYGLRQLVDVALKALSPGVNDPTTAQDAIFHIAAVLHDMLRRPVPPRRILGRDGRRLLVPGIPSHTDLIGLAFDELRLAAAPHPTVCGYLLEAIRLAGSGLHHRGRSGRVAADELFAQARLVVADCERAGVSPWDLERVHANYEERFGPLPTGGTASRGGGPPPLDARPRHDAG
jgi:uncharacterized membrane protein